MSLSTDPSSLSFSERPFLPTTPEEMAALGWEQPDVVFVSGDAYIDHPSFAAAILGRWLEAHGYKVAILAQPDWRSADPWLAMGRPRLFYGVSAGNMDSMINHYTANRKRRNADAYSPGGRIDLRPDRPTAIYAQRCREAFKGVPVIAGGVEASLRRIAHYDYWSDKVMPSILTNSKADLLAYGMGERSILEIARRLEEGEPVEALRDMRGVAYLLGRTEALPPTHKADHQGQRGTITLPSFKEVTEDKVAFALMTRAFHKETNPWNAKRMVQDHGDRTVVINPPGLPLDTAQMDQLHGLAYTRRPHPVYTEPVPAWTVIKDSVQIMRGCFGGCTFCSITMHQGRTIQSRSEDSILQEVRDIAADPDFKGHISDLGGPTANMYRMHCSKPEVEKTCKRLSCVHPSICPMLDTDHAPLTRLMRKSREIPGIKKVHIASGLRMDLASGEREYLDELTRHHVGGQLKVAPEHVSDRVLKIMKKPGAESFREFTRNFEAASRRAGKEQYLVPYFISGHPGSDVEDMIEVAIFLKETGHEPRQVQDFIPGPMDIATCIYHTGIDPVTMQPVYTARKLKDRKLQRALLQFFKPENYFTVRDALRGAGREDLIGSGPQCLIPANPPREALRSRDGEGEGGGKGGGGGVGYRRASRTGGKSRGGGKGGGQPQGDSSERGSSERSSGGGSGDGRSGGGKSGGKSGGKPGGAPGGRSGGKPGGRSGGASGGRSGGGADGRSSGKAGGGAGDGAAGGGRSDGGQPGRRGSKRQPSSGKRSR